MDGTDLMWDCFELKLFWFEVALSETVLVGTDLMWDCFDLKLFWSEAILSGADLM